MIIDVPLAGPLVLNDSALRPRLEQCDVADDGWGIYLETIEVRSGEFLACYVGAAYGSSLRKRINTRIKYDRRNDCRIDASSFVAGKRVWLPGNRSLKLDDANDRSQMDKVYGALRLFVSPLKIDDSAIASWLGSKRVKNPRRYFVQCVENEIIRQIKESGNETASFLYNEPQSYLPMSIRVFTSRCAVIGLAASSSHSSVLREQDIIASSNPPPSIGARA
jgi:hypothetical protein